MSFRYTILLILLTLSAFGFYAFKTHAKNFCWMVYYGSNDVVSAQVQWAIVSESYSEEFRKKNPHTKFIAYVSVGELNKNDQNFDSAKVANVEQNPNWPEAFRVDVRHPAWKSHIVTKFNNLKDNGFSGVFLDTLDTPIYLEDRDPKKFSGSKVALVTLVAEAKKVFSKKNLVIANGGLPELKNFEPYIDALLLEDYSTGFDFKNKKAVKSSDETRAWKNQFLKPFFKTKKRVLNLIYRDGQDDAFVKDRISDATTNNMSWYVTGVDLNQRGITTCD